MAMFQAVSNALTGTEQDPSSMAIQALLAAPVINPQDLFINLERVVQQGQLTPEQAQSVIVEKSKMGEIDVDPKLIEDQYSVLKGLGDIVQQGGMTAIDKARLEDIRREEQTVARGAREAATINAAQRGVSGGGLEQLQRMMAEQSAAEQSSARGTTVAAEAQKRALEALLQQGTLAGQMRTQQFGEQTTKAQAADEIAKFNAANSQQVALANMAQRAQTQQLNQAEAQRIAELNAAQQSQEAQSRVAAMLAAAQQGTDLSKALSSQYMAQAGNQLKMRELTSQEQQAMAQLGLQSRGMDITQAQNLAQNALRGQELTAQQQQALATLGLEQQKMAQAQQQALAQLGMQGRQLDITQQANLASQSIQQQTLASAERQNQINQMFKERELSVQERQALADLGFKERQLTVEEQQALANQQLKQAELLQQQQANLATQGLRSRELDIGQQTSQANLTLEQQKLAAATADAAANRALKQQEVNILKDQAKTAGKTANNQLIGQAIQAAPTIIKGIGDYTPSIISGVGSVVGGIGDVVGDIAGGIGDFFGSIFSDEQMKDHVNQLSDEDVDRILGNLTGYKYQYKHDPSNEQHYGVMAQDLEKTPLGNVQNTPVGKTVSYDTGDIHALTAALANIHNRVKNIEGNQK